MIFFNDLFGQFQIADNSGGFPFSHFSSFGPKPVQIFPDRKSFFRLNTPLAAGEGRVSADPPAQAGGYSS